MKNESKIYRAYAWVRVLFGALTLLRLGLLGLERYAVGQYVQLLDVVQELPAPILELPDLLQQQEKLWTAWTWVWEHGWMVFLALLLLPKLKGVLRIGTMVRDLVVELARALSGAVRRTVGWVIRLRCKEVTLMGCQYVVVGYQDGSEQVVNIRESRTWSGWRGAAGAQACLRCSDKGEVTLEWPEGKYRRLEDRCPVSPGAALREHYPELRAVERITLYDDFGR